MHRLLMLALLLVACGGGDATGPPAPDVGFDRYESVSWTYSYNNVSTGRSEGLDSVRGSLLLALAQAPADRAEAWADVPVVIYFWIARPDVDTVRGAQLIWPAGGVTRGRYAVADTTLRLVGMSPPTFLNDPFAVFYGRPPDTLVYVLEWSDPDETVLITIPFARGS